jgi:hypothetical protein
VLFTVALAAVSLFLRPSLACAYRPFTGTDAGVATLDKLEVEFGPLGYLRTGSERQLISPELNIVYGAGSGFEFGAGARRLVLMSPDAQDAHPRIDDIEIAAKKLLKAGSVQDKAGLSVAAEGVLLIPSSREHRFGAGLLLVASQSWENLALHLNGEASRTREGDAGRFVSLIAEGPGLWGVRPVSEAAVERVGEESTLHTLLMGFIWETRSGLAMDLGYTLGYADVRISEYRAGVTWNRHVSGPKLPRIPPLIHKSR